MFDATEEAAQNNFCVLSKYAKDLGRALEAQKLSPLWYRSKFRPDDSLKQVFGLHPNWSGMKRILEVGSDWSMADLDCESSSSDVKEALEFGNHKGVTEKLELLKQLVFKDITHGYALIAPLPKVQHASQVCHLPMASMNIQKQNSINEHGRIFGKDCLIHDLSYKWGSGTSVNSRVEKDSLLPCKFGACIKYLTNWAVAARKKYPNQKILCTKIDYKSAYQRCQLNKNTAIQTYAQLPDENLAIIALRLMFGGATGPYE